MAWQTDLHQAAIEELKEDPVAEPKTHDSDPAAPRAAEGIDLMGEYKGSGFEEPPYLVRRLDGQVVHLSRLLYLVVEAADGQRDFGQIAERLSQEFGRQVTADNVRFLVEERLRPLGVLAAPEGETSEPPPRLAEPLLGLRYRLGLLPTGVVRSMTTPFLPFFWPPVIVAVLGGLLALDVWLLFHGVLQGAREIIYQPALYALAFFGLEMVAMAWHECGHATACRYGGAKPGVVGVGIYVVWFVFYSDVTDSYRLDKVGRLRVDFGGIYFDAIFTLVLAGAYFFTGFEPLLILILFNQLGALGEFSPFLRLDGYYILSDLTGVPDLFKSIKPTLKSLIPGQEADEQLKALKPWVRVVITTWVLAVVPVLLFGCAMLVIYGPWVIATAGDSLFIQYSEVIGAFTEDGRVIHGILGMVNIGALVVPMVGAALFFALLIKRGSVAGWCWSKGRPPLRVGLVLALAAVTAGLLLSVWSPKINSLADYLLYNWSTGI